MLYRNDTTARWRAWRCAPVDPPRQAEGLRLAYETPVAPIRLSAPIRSRDVPIGNPPPQPAPAGPATVQLSSSMAVSETHPKNDLKIEGSMDAKWMPMGVPKLSKNRTNGLQGPSREPLGTHSMNHPVSERSREGPMCLPYSK